VAKKQKLGKPVTGTDGHDIIAPDYSIDGLRINAGDGNDDVTGTMGNDVINAGDGDDLIFAGEGDDVIRGGDGLDTARFEGSLFDYVLTEGQGNSLIVDDVVGTSGTDTLKQIEVLQFSDFSYQVGVNNGVFASDDIAATDEATPVTIDVLANDVDLEGDSFSISTFDATSGNGASISLDIDGNLIYDPSGSAVLGALGAEDSLVDTFSYWVTDAEGNISEASVSVTVSGLDPIDPPGDDPAPIIDVSVDSYEGFALTGIEAENDIGLGVRMRVSNLGDINGDGYDDVAVGAGNADGSAPQGDNGEAYVLFGTAAGIPPDLTPGALDGTNGFVIPSTQTGDATSDFAGDLMGNSISGAGDVNGDGIDDFIVSAFYHDEPDGGTIEGRAYVVYGTTSGFGPLLDLDALSPGEGIVITAGSSDRYLGSDVSGAGDFNGDGIDDLIISTDNTNGRAYVVFGSASGLPDTINADDIGGSVAGIEITGQSRVLDAVVSSAGDLNGDGFDDLIVSEALAFADDGTAFVGSAHVIFGSSSPVNVDVDGMAAQDGFTFSGTQVFDRVGFRVSEAGDINGDGISDIILAGFPAGGGGGEAYVIFGNDDPNPVWPGDLDDLDGSNGFVILADPSDSVVHSVSDAGDINNDGIADLVIGTSQTAYVVFGSDQGHDPTLDLTDLTESEGFVLEGFTGEALDVSAGGDVNGDGIDDLVIGDWTSNGGDSAAYVIYGSDPLII